MYRLPLLLETPSVSWDRSLCECILFEKTLNYVNVNETIRFIKVNEDETNMFFNLKSETSAADYDASIILLKKKKTIEALELINDIIFSAPKDSVPFQSALRLRGNIYYSENHLDQAARDYEIFAYVAPSFHEGLIEVYGKLLICQYMLNNFKQAKHTLVLYQKQKKIMKKKIKNFRMPDYGNGEIISKIIDAVKQKKDIPPLNSTNEKGENTFQLNSNVSYTFKKKSKGYFANREVPARTLLFVEKPFYVDLGTPFIQCEYCFKASAHLHTCLDCRYKTYCSLNCMLTDTEHDIECGAYKDLTLITLDAKHIFRLFARSSFLLSRDVFPDSKFKDTKNASEVWSKMMKFTKPSENLQILKLIFDDCDYKKLSPMQYSTIVAVGQKCKCLYLNNHFFPQTSFRLAIYISEKTEIIETFFEQLQISFKQKLILTGSILMRLSCQIINNTLDFDIKILMDYKQLDCPSLNDFIKNKVKSTEPIKNYLEDPEKYYRTNYERDVLHICKSILQEEEEEKEEDDKGPIQKPLLQSIDLETQRGLDDYKIFISTFILNQIDFGKTQHNGSTSEKIAAMDMESREAFVRMFTMQFHSKYSAYFIKRRGVIDIQSQCITLTCPKLSKFKHSCDPNVEIMFLENGIVIGKAIRNLEAEEELCVSFKVHHQKHPKKLRKEYLESLKIVCLCKYCEMPEIEEPYNIRMNIFCENCSVMFSLADGKCSECGIDYFEQLSRHENFMWRLESSSNLQKFNDERKMFEFYLAKDFISRNFYPQYHEIRIKHYLEFANFLACKNFAMKAFEIVEQVFRDLKMYYCLDLFWFSYLNQIVDILKILLYYNINRKYSTAKTGKLHRMIEMGLYILRGQLEYIKFFEIFNSYCKEVMQNLRFFFYWNDILGLLDTNSSESANQLEVKKELPGLIEIE